jgi:hypothetical protein
MFNASIRAAVACLLSTLATAALSQAAAPVRPGASAPIALPGSEVTMCTEVPRSEWMEEADFQAIAARRGFKTLKFKVSRGNCYEIYGFDRNGQLVEVYFNPVNGRIVQQNKAKP